MTIYFVLLFLSGSAIAGQDCGGTNQPPCPLADTLSTAQNNATNDASILKYIIARNFIFAAWPEYGLTDDTTTFDINNPPLYPTTSINSSAVDALYTTQMGVPAQLVSYIKAFYFYFEYCARREKAAKLLTLLDNTLETPSLDALADTVKDLLAQNGWQAIIDAVAKNGPVDYSVMSTQDGWDAVTGALQATFTQENLDITKLWNNIAQSSFWKAIPITNDDLQNSLFWQDYLKFSIYNSVYGLDVSLVKSKLVSAEQLFNYIPHLETTYYVPNCVEHRYSTELAQLSLVLNEHLRNRMRVQCVDWKNFNDQALAQPTGPLTQFSKTDIYSLVHDKILKTGAAQMQQSVTNIPSFTVSDPQQHEVRFLSMALTVQALLAEFVKTQKADNISTLFAQISASKSRPTPSILPYDVEDAVYMDDFMHITAELPQAADQSAAQIPAVEAAATSIITLTAAPATTSTASSGATADNESVTPQSFWDDVKHIASNVGSAIKNTAVSGWATVKDVAEAVASEAKVFYYQSGLATLCQNLPPDQAQKLADANRAAFNRDITSFRSDMTTTVENLVKVVVAPASSVIETTLAAIGEIVHDPSLTDDYEKMVDAFADAIGTVYSAAGDIVIDAGMKLTVDGISLLTSSVIALSTDPTKGGFGGMWDEWKDIGSDIVSTVLESVTFVVGAVTEIIKDLLQACTYLIKLITDTIVDVGPIVMGALIGALAGVSGGLFGANTGMATYSQWQQWFQTHRVLISQIVTTGILIGVTIATGGEGAFLGMSGGTAFGVAMNLGFGYFMCKSGAAQDADIADAQQEIQDYLNRFTTWTNNQEIIGKGMQAGLSHEVASQLNAEIMNRQIGLGHVQNFFADTVDSYYCQNAFTQGTLQAQLLAPNANGLLPGDVGTLFGWKTGWMSLNPTHGLVLYEPSRNAFAQEVAQKPAVITDPTTGQQTIEFWFLQSITKDFTGLRPDQPITFEAKIKPIYLLDSFYVGIGIGGLPVKQSDVVATHMANLDRFNLTKMIVCRKESHDANPVLSVYEHESPLSASGWLGTPIPVPFETNTSYRIQGQLSGNQLIITMWDHNNTQIASQTVMVTPLPTTDPFDRSQCPPVPTSPGTALLSTPLTIIYAGASIEFTIKQPQEIAACQQANTSAAYTCSDAYKKVTPPQKEADREKAYALQFEQSIKPTFGGQTLTALSVDEVIKGHYIYAISTNAPVGLTQDYVFFATQDTDKKIKNIGISPVEPAANVIVSLITGMVYDNTLKLIGFQSNVWSAYKNSLGEGSAIGATVYNTIKTALAAFAKNVKQAQVNLGRFVLQAVQTTDIDGGRYIYKVTPPGPVPTGYDDYVVLAQFGSDGSITSYGMPYSNTPLINGLISLVSTLTFPANTSAYPQPDATSLAAPVPQICYCIIQGTCTAANCVSSGLKKTITDSIAQYNKIQQAAASAQANVSGTDIAGPSGAQPSTPALPPVPSDVPVSLDDQQYDASEYS